MKYIELLKYPQWIKRRNEILTRDKNTCQFCGAQDRYLHVHHKEYIQGRMPWEYDDDDLISLCEDCHNMVHQDKTQKMCCISIGQVYLKYHSDYENICIVYNIDYYNEIIYTLEFDNGAGLDTVYDEKSTYNEFSEKYCKCEQSYDNINDMFASWFIYVSKHIDDMPPLFKYRFEEVISNNTGLRNIISE